MYSLVKTFLNEPYFIYLIRLMVSILLCNTNNLVSVIYVKIVKWLYLWFLSE